MKIDWQQYSEHLNKIGFSEEETDKVKTFIDTHEHCTFEQFQELFKQGIVVRTLKLKKPRNLYVCENGNFWYLNKVRKEFNYIGYFKNGEEE